MRPDVIQSLEDLTEEDVENMSPRAAAILHDIEQFGASANTVSTVRICIVFSQSTAKLQIDGTTMQLCHGCICK